MPAPFRSDLDAARARADVLEEENDELREEVARLRVAAPVRLDAAPEADPAIAKFSEETLERLDEMTHEIEAVEAPALEPSSAKQPTAGRAREAAAPFAADLEVVRLRAQLERAVGERDLARAAAPKIPGAALFALGLFVGLLAGVLLASLR